MKFALAVIAAFGVGIAGAGGVSQLSGAAQQLSSAPALPSALAVGAVAATAAGTMAAAASAMGVNGPKGGSGALPGNPVAAFADLQNKLANSRAQTPIAPRVAIPTYNIRSSASSPGRSFRRR